jgi:hypothetical protein
LGGVSLLLQAADVLSQSGESWFSFEGSQGNSGLFLICFDGREFLLKRLDLLTQSYEDLGACAV